MRARINPRRREAHGRVTPECLDCAFRLIERAEGLSPTPPGPRPESSQSFAALDFQFPVKSIALIEGIVRFFGGRGLHRYLSWALLRVWGF